LITKEIKERYHINKKNQKDISITYQKKIKNKAKGGESYLASRSKANGFCPKLT
jgi:hypothetical protein